MPDLADVLDALKKNHNLVTNRMVGVEARLKHLESNFGSRRVSFPGLEDEKEKFSILRVIRSLRFGNWDDAPFEKEIMDQVRKQMGTTTGPGGGFLVPVQLLADFIELLAAKAVCIQMGATLLNGLEGGEVGLVKQTGGGTCYWVAEGLTIPTSELTVGQLTLHPKAIAALVIVNNQLIKRSTPSAEALVRSDITRALAREVDRVALRGSGVETQPLGIANTPNIGTYALGTDGGYLSFEHIVDMEGVLEDANALDGALGIVWCGAVKRKLKKMRIPQWSGDTAGEFVMLPMTDAMLRDHVGYNFGTSNQIPKDLVKGTSGDCSEVYFGNWEELLLANWGGIEILASQETSDAFEKNQTWIRIIQEIDCGLRHPESFCLVSDARTT